MTIETEQSKKVSNEQLLTDIDHTEIEVAAYGKLCSGFFDLSQLPENEESGNSRLQAFESHKYATLQKECTAFLEKLLALKTERGL